MDLFDDIIPFINNIKNGCDEEHLFITEFMHFVLNSGKEFENEIIVVNKLILNRYII
jgi:hypothetical protein